MIIERRSTISGRVNQMEIDVDVDKLQEWDNDYRDNRPLIQNYFPELDEDEREFILTGITSQEWDELYSECE